MVHMSGVEWHDESPKKVDSFHSWKAGDEVNTVINNQHALKEWVYTGRVEPDENDGISSYKSLGTDKDTPSSRKQMSFGLSCKYTPEKCKKLAKQAQQKGLQWSICYITTRTHKLYLSNKIKQGKTTLQKSDKQFECKILFCGNIISAC